MTTYLTDYAHFTNKDDMDQATKRKEIRNLPGYFSGVLREHIGKALFSDIYQDYDVPVEGFYRH